MYNNQYQGQQQRYNQPPQGQYPQYTTPYAQQTQQPQQPQVQQPQFKAKMVSSIDEVKATTVDFDGSLNIFVDLTNNRIYTKQLNNNGLADTKTYALDSTPEVVITYATKSDFESMSKRLKKLESGEKKNDK